jgi:hypothetical protein
MGLAGCSRAPYRNTDLTPDSAEGREINEQLATLKNGGAAGVPAFMRAHAAVDNERAAMLQWALGQLVTADALELRSVDAFGPDIVRAVIAVKRGGAEQENTFLLVRKDHRLQWASPN